MTDICCVLRGDGLTTPAEAAKLLHSRAYLKLLLVAAIIGVLVSAFAWGFLALVSKLQHWLYSSLPSGLGLGHPPAWWPFPLLAFGGLLVALVIRYLPGTGGHSPTDGFKAGGVFPPIQLPGIFLAALATLGFGAVLGPEAPLIALGGGLAGWAVSRARGEGADRAKIVIASAGSFAAIATLLGSPLTGAFLLMEAAGLGGATMELVLIPGLLAAGVGALVFTGLGHWSGLGAFSLAIPGLPHFSRPTLAEIGYSVLVGLAAALVGLAIRRSAVLLRGLVQPRPLIAIPLAGLAVAGLAVLFSQVTGKGSQYVLYSGQNEIGPFVAKHATFTLGALMLLLACKAVAYSVSLSSFRGGPTFPAIFIGGVAGAALSYLPGLPLVAAMAMGIGAMTAAMLRLPMTAVLVAALLLMSDGVAVLPLVIVAVVTAYVTIGWLDPPADA